MSLLKSHPDLSVTDELTCISWRNRKYFQSARPSRDFCGITFNAGIRDHYDDVIMCTMASQITSLTIVYSTVYSDADQRKHQSSASLAFVRGIRRGPVNSPHKWPVTRKMFPFHDVIMIERIICGSPFANTLTWKQKVSVDTNVLKRWVYYFVKHISSTSVHWIITNNYKMYECG